MENRKEKIFHIRPDIGLSENDYHSALEEFQNKTLRPILKLQHNLTKQMLLVDKNFDTKILRLPNSEEKKRRITNFLQKNTNFRNQLVGTIIGMMTTDEFDFYQEDRSKINKRIFSMQLQRYLDSFS